MVLAVLLMRNKVGFASTGRKSWWSGRSDRGLFYWLIPMAGSIKNVTYT